MKGLDKTKVYDLRDLNNDQLQYFNKMFGKKIDLERTPFISFIEGNWYLTFSTSCDKTNAITLFEPQLQIGQTFEYNGFICEVKEKIEGKKWYRIIDKFDNLYFEEIPIKKVTTSEKYGVKSITEITDQEFISQLDKHSK